MCQYFDKQSLLSGTEHSALFNQTHRLLLCQRKFNKIFRPLQIIISYLLRGGAHHHV